MLIVRLAGDHLYGEIAVHLAVACDVFIDVSLCCPFSHEMSWINSGTLLGRFLRVFLPTFIYKFIKYLNLYFLLVWEHKTHSESV